MARKLLALALTVVLCLAIAVPTAMAGATTTVKLTGIDSGLNVRSGPGTNYKVAGWVKHGDEIELLSVGTTWTKIQVVSTRVIGYIKNSYITDLPRDSDTPSKPSSCVAARVSGRSVNMRLGPGTSYASKGALPQGTKLSIWGQKGNWYYAATLAGAKGWISKSYVSVGYSAKTSARVNFRATPNGKLIKTLSSGTSVTVTAISGSWSKVKVGSSVGYVFSKYLR